MCELGNAEFHKGSFGNMEGAAGQRKESRGENLPVPPEPHPMFRAVERNSMSASMDVAMAAKSKTAAMTNPIMAGRLYAMELGSTEPSFRPHGNEHLKLLTLNGILDAGHGCCAKHARNTRSCSERVQRLPLLWTCLGPMI
jgi:hypothetical protein